MHRDNRKYIAKSEKYKGVSKVYQDGKYKWWARCYVNHNRWEKYTDTEREAAIAYDKYMIKIGREPINVLKPKVQV